MFRSRVYAGLKIKKKKTPTFAPKAFINASFTVIDLVCHVGFTSLFFTNFYSLLGQEDFPSQTCFLPIYIEAIFLSVIFPETILAFLLRDRLNWREADQQQPEDDILEWIVSEPWFFILKLYIFDGGS